MQNVISGLWICASAGMYVVLSLLGAGGGRPDSTQVAQVVNATLCSVWFFSSSFGGSILNKLGPGVTMYIGVQTAGMVFITAGYISTAYPEEKEKGSYATMLINLQALGTIIGGIIAVIINRNTDTAAGVPRPVYISFIMICGGLLGLLLLRPQKLGRDDGSVTAVNPAKAYLNNLRTRSLLSFVAVVLQIPAGWALQWILDRPYWGRHKRGLIGLATVAVPMLGAWTWEMIRTRNYNRNNLPYNPTDWDEPSFGWIFVLFMMTWVSANSGIAPSTTGPAP
ncbi:hypothetical protein CC78DRAFT_589839 [Lojkania enalia]|uniref:Uncharacterized protein n=1 Tax=Lojkania enalia TaxID=147567 RepID=A0A9P4K6E6_9PLEO|nr:hypothetical protein CC78DRAFT_589839 [Didymosphaeria enalia]